MKILLPLALAACGGSSSGPPIPPPTIDSLGPTTGLWGTQITIDGANFGAVQGTATVAFAGSVGANGFVIDDWQDGEITGRVAFPATGDVSVHTPGGAADAGTFTTMEPWAPSAAIDVDQLDGQLALSTGDVAALFDEYELGMQPTLAVFSGSSLGTYPLTGLASPFDARLVEADDHSPEALATQSDGTVGAFGVVGGALVITQTGLTGSVVCAARDGTGVYAWLQTASGLVRARPGTPWTVDRGPIATTQPALDGAVAADGTLWIAISDPAPASMAYIAVQTLGPVATTLTAPELADPTSYSTSISDAHVMLAGDGVHAVVLATADDGGTPTTLTPRLRTAAATWSDAPALTGLVQYAFIGSTLAALVNDAQDKTTSLVPDVTMPANAQVIPVWPMQSEGLVVDGAGLAYPLITNGSVTYALSPPP